MDCLSNRMYATPEETYNIVNCCSMLYHIRKESTALFIHLLAQSVSAGGVLILETDHPPVWIHRFWSWVYRYHMPALDYDMRNLSYNYTLQSITEQLGIEGFSVKAKGINFLTSLLPFPATTSIECPKWIRRTYKILAWFDQFVSPFFPNYSANFIIVATKKR